MTTTKPKAAHVPRALPLLIGMEVKPYGKIGAVMFTGGERYYMMSDGSDVALMPWFVVEQDEE